MLVLWTLAPTGCLGLAGDFDIPDPDAQVDDVPVPAEGGTGVPPRAAAGTTQPDASGAPDVGAAPEAPVDAGPPAPHCDASKGPCKPPACTSAGKTCKGEKG